MLKMLHKLVLEKTKVNKWKTVTPEQ